MSKRITQCIIVARRRNDDGEKISERGANYEGKIQGYFEATGLRPRFLEDLRAMGIEFPGKYFEPGKPQA